MSEPAHPYGNAPEPEPSDTTPLPRVSGNVRPAPTMHGELPPAPVGGPAGQPTGRMQPAPGRQQYDTQAVPPPPPEPWRGPVPRSKPLRYSLYGIGLVVVAVVAGLIWWAAHPTGEPVASQNTGQTTTQQQSRGKYQFAKAHGTVRGKDCEKHSYGKIQQFFSDTPCQQLSRTIYWTRVKNVRVFSSVSVVTMRTASQATSLEHLTDSNGTGNVTDLLGDGVRVSGAPKTVKGGGYASGRNGKVVTIVESKPEVGKHLAESVVTGVSRDALRLGGK